MSETKTEGPPAAKPAAPALPKTPVSAPPSAAVYETANPTRRGFLGAVAIGWTAFAASVAVSLGLMQRFLYPNVLYEPPQSFKAGFPADFPVGVDERFKAK